MIQASRHELSSAQASEVRPVHGVGREDQERERHDRLFGEETEREQDQRHRDPSVGLLTAEASVLRLPYRDPTHPRQGEDLNSSESVQAAQRGGYE